MKFRNTATSCLVPSMDPKNSANPGVPHNRIYLNVFGGTSIACAQEVFICDTSKLSSIHKDPSYLGTNPLPDLGCATEFPEHIMQVVYESLYGSSDTM